MQKKKPCNCRRKDKETRDWVDNTEKFIKPKEKVRVIRYEGIHPGGGKTAERGYTKTPKVVGKGMLHRLWQAIKRIQFI